MTSTTPYPIGRAGEKWTDTDKKQWLNMQSVKRSYADEVVSKIKELHAYFEIIEYGALSIDASRYPLFALKAKDFDKANKTVLITGGVHGYETSGVHGALKFAAERVAAYNKQFNFIIVPCVSPWGYETINRWNSKAIDPNRSFYDNSPAEESDALMQLVDSIEGEIIAHFDLHETTDTDNSEFRPALAARDATIHDNWNIPDGFYLVGNNASPQDEFQRSIIDSVRKVTHIAPADENGRLIGALLEQFGVINYAARDLGLCMGLTDAKYTTTTEVYPDSPKVDDANCNLAQMTVITSGLDFILSKDNLTK